MVALPCNSNRDQGHAAAQSDRGLFGVRLDVTNVAVTECHYVPVRVRAGDSGCCG